MGSQDSLTGSGPCFVRGNLCSLAPCYILHNREQPQEERPLTCHHFGQIHIPGRHAGLFTLNPLEVQETLTFCSPTVPQSVPTMASLRVQQALRLAQRRLLQATVSSPALHSGYAQQSELTSIHRSSPLLHCRFVACGTGAAGFVSPTEIGAPPFRTPFIWTVQRAYAKKASVKQPAARVQVKPAQPRPRKPAQPVVEGSSVKNRNHKKRMLQRAEFAKKQAQETIKAVRLSIARRDSARVKRWKEGAERARAWAQLVASRKQSPGAVPRPVAVVQ